MVRWIPSAPGYDELALSRNLSTIRQAAPQLAVHWNTGRGLELMQKAVRQLAPILARHKATVDYLSLNNGKELYINKRHQRADQWILSLKPSDQESAWTRLIQRLTGWDHETVLQTRTDVLKRMGYHPASNSHPAGENTLFYIKESQNRRFVVRTHDTQSGFLFYEIVTQPNGEMTQVYDAEQEQMALELLNTFVNALRQKGIQVQSRAVRSDRIKDVCGVLEPYPSGIDKGFATQKLLQEYFSDPKAVITVGDSTYNDQELLAPKTFSIERRARQKPSGAPLRQVPNYPIVSGNNPALVSRAQSPNLEVTETHGHISGALQRQLDKITQGKQLLLFA